MRARGRGDDAADSRGDGRQPVRGDAGRVARAVRRRGRRPLLPRVCAPASDRALSFVLGRVHGRGIGGVLSVRTGHAHHQLTVIYVVIGAVPMLAAVSTLRRSRPDVHRPFRMWLHPLPSLIALAGWVFIVATSGLVYIAAGLGLLALGIGVYLWRARRSGEWPFIAM
jgi:hypothetical protein